MSAYAVLTWDSYEMDYTDVSDTFASKSAAVKHALELYDDLFYRGAPETDHIDFDLAILDMRGSWVPFAHFEFDSDDADSIKLVYNYR